MAYIGTAARTLADAARHLTESPLHGVLDDEGEEIADHVEAAKFLVGQFSEAAKTGKQEEDRLWLGRSASRTVRWWRMYGRAFPRLEALVAELGSHHLTSVAVERLFSKMNHLDTPRRNRLTTSRLGDSLFVCHNERELRRLAAAKAKATPGAPQPEPPTWHCVRGVVQDARRVSLDDDDDGGNDDATDESDDDEHAPPTATSGAGAAAAAAASTTRTSSSTLPAPNAE